MVKEYLMLLTLAFSTFHKVAYKLADKDKLGNVLTEITFPFNTIRLKIDTWVWFFFEHANMVIFAILVSLPGEVKRICGVTFVWIYLVDFVSFILVYGDPFRDILLTWNVCKILIFMGSIYIASHLNENYEWRK
jgi:hypothetical protein